MHELKQNTVIQQHTDIKLPKPLKIKPTGDIKTFMYIVYIHDKKNI